MADFKGPRYWCREFIGWLLLGVALSAQAAPNRVEEAGLLEQLKEDLRQGQIVEIPLEAGKFSAVYAPARTQTARGAVVFLPEAGWRVDSPVASGIERYLPAHGWDVLSLQLPVLDAVAGPEEYRTLLPDGSARLKAAVDWLKSQGGEAIAAVGHGFGGLVLLKYLAEPEPQLKAAVLLSLAWPESASEEIRAWLQAVRIPVLDVYAEQDHSKIKATATERHLLLKDKPAYRQLQFSAADHHYHAKDELLARRIDGWLRRVVPNENSDE